LLNYQLESVAGFSIDFGLLNTSGFLFYSIYVIGGILYPGLGTGEIYIVDLLFPTHCFLIAAATLAQWWIYERGVQKTFKPGVVLVVFLQWVIVFMVFWTQIMLKSWLGLSLPNSLNLLMITGYMKTTITFFKYWPQVYLNFIRKSTKGLSMPYIFLDLSGGAFSLLQQGIGKS
jgi:cystinosin